MSSSGKSIGDPPSCYLCQPELRDPLTIALGFMRNPAPFRQCSHFTLEVFNQLVYLQGFLSPNVAYAIRAHRGEASVVHAPVLLDWIQTTCEMQVAVRDTSSSAGCEIRFVSMLCAELGTPLRLQKNDPAARVLPAQLRQLPCLTINHHFMRWVSKSSSKNTKQKTNYTNNNINADDNHDEESIDGDIVFTSAKKLCDIGEGIEKEAVRARIRQFYETHSPENVSKAENAMQKDMTEDEILRILRDKYSVLDRKAGVVNSRIPVVAVRANFCSGIPCFHSVILEDLPEVREIKDGVFSNSPMGGTFTLRNLPRLARIGLNFLGKCHSLKSATFEDLPNLLYVGDGWLDESTSLENFTLRNIPNLRSHGRRFLANANQLREVVEISNLPELQTLDGLYQCENLKTFSAIGLPKLHTLGAAWGCAKLQLITLKDLPELTTLNDCCFYDCAALTTFTLQNLPNLKKIKTMCLWKCTSLKVTNFYNLPELDAVQWSWMYECDNLEKVSFIDLPKLSSVGYQWLSKCPKLVNVTFENLPSLEGIGEEFLGGSTSSSKKRCEALHIKTSENCHPGLKEAIDKAKSSSCVIQ